MALPGAIAGTLSAMALLVFAVQARGQEGTLATFGLSFGGSYTVNDPGENESDLASNLRFDLQSVTRTQSVGLSADGRLVFDGGRVEFERPGITIDYARESRSTALNLGLSYSVRDVDGAAEIIDPVTGTVINLVDDDGTLESLGINAALVTGQDAPFGTQTSFSYVDRTYSGTADPDLTDLTNWQIGTTLRFDVDPRISLSTNASYRVTQEDDDEQTERRVTRFGVGGSFLIDPLWSASFDLGYSIFETEEDQPGLGRVITEENGTGFTLSVTRQFRDGSLSASLARDVSDNGTEDSLRLSRERALSNGGALAWSVGLISFPNGETAPVVSAAYTMPTPRGSFSASINQASSFNSDDESVVSTSIALNYDQAVNASSSWAVNGSVANVEVVGDQDQGQTRAQIGISYNHALTQDWDLSTALRHQIIYEDGEEDESASTLSLSLQRSFSFRP